MAGSVSLCSGQELAKTAGMAEETGAEITQEANPWHISAGLVYKNWLYEHDGLQQRAPSASKRANDWEEGNTDGTGWGLHFEVGRGDGAMHVTFVKSDFTFEYAPPGGNQKVDTLSRDLDVSWQQVRGRNDQAQWGSVLGFRYIGQQKDVTLAEGLKTGAADGIFPGGTNTATKVTVTNTVTVTNAVTVSGTAHTTWLLLQGGYFGRWRPFDSPSFVVRGRLLFLLGEVEGLARSGSDEDWSDGVISETYGNEYSMAYGANASFGIDVAITKRVWFTVEYMREWLYSFEATDSGYAVFPDNYDALFIENQHAVVATLNYLF
jgi:hypothetical protein